MQNANTKIQNFLEKHKIEKRHLFILLLLSVMVIIIVCVSLITPAISMSHDIICGMDEHTHNEQCFSNVLVCTENTEDHQHSDECYNEEQALICNIPQTEGHIHDEQCYETGLVCEKDEHSHTAECYKMPTLETNSTEPELEQADNQAVEPEDSGQLVLDPVDAEKNINEIITFSSDIMILNGDTTIIDDSSVDFENFIKKIECKEVAGNNSENLKTVKFTINYTLPGNTLMNDNENRQIHCLLPDNIVISESREGIVRREGKEIGTYQITADGYVIIDFDPNFVKDGSTTITGDISFNANVLHKDNGSDYETVNIGKVTTTIPFPADSKPSEDLSINKTFVGEYDRAQNKAHYKIEIQSYNGSGSGTITLKDAFSGEHKSFISHDWKDGDTVTFTKSDGTTFTAPVKVSADGTSAVIEGLPPLKANESYSLEYTATVTSDNQTPIIDTNNKASISNGILSDSVECHKQIAVNSGISKNGQYNSKTDMIKWTIKVTNPSGEALNGYTITDEMLGSAANGLVIKDENGNIIETLNADNNWKGTVGRLDIENKVFSFNDNSKNKEYTLFYETKLPDRSQIAGNQVSNRATLKHDDIQINAVAKPWISADRQYIYKSLSQATYDENGNVTADWNTELEFQEGDFSNRTFTDTISTISYDTDSDNDYHYMAPAQKSSLMLVGYDALGNEYILTKGTDYSVAWFGKDGKPTNSETDNIYSFKILFIDNANVAKLCDVNISYSTTGVTSSMQSGDVREYHNQAEFMGKIDSASCWEQKKEPFYKYDCSVAGQVSKENISHHNANELTKTANGELILKWYITANESHCWSNTDDAVFTDILPAGVRLNERKMSYSISQNNGNSYDIVRNAPIMHTISTVEDGKQCVNFNIPAGFHKGRPFRIQYEVIVSEDYLINNKDARGKTNFKNTVTDGNFTLEQTQVIERTLITKTGADPADTYDGYINYTIDVNPKAENLSGKGKVTLTDAMTYKYSWFIPTLNSLEVYSVSVDENGIEVLTPLETSKYTLKTYDDGITAKFVIDLPDETHLKVKYTYYCVCTDDIDPDNYWGTRVYNSAVLEFNGNSQDAKFEEVYQLTQDSEAHAVTNKNVKISKVDSENYGIKLKDAGFSLYMWDNNKWLTLTGIETDKYDSDIKNPVWGGEEGTDGVVPYIIITNDKGKADLPKIQSGAIYKILEQTAPKDYVKSNIPYYFALDSAPTDHLPDDEEFDAYNLQVFHNGGTINIENTKMQKTEIKVEKYWHEASEFTGEHDKIEVGLYANLYSPEIKLNISDVQGNEITKVFKVKRGENYSINIRTLNGFCERGKGGKVSLNGEAVDVLWENYNDIWVNEHTENWWNDPNQYSSYNLSFENVTTDMKWDIYFNNAQDYTKYVVSVTGAESDESLNGLPDGSILVGKATLDASNNWTHIWDDIPACNESDCEYIYYVKENEESIPAGYTVSYDNNGINSGTISITNTGEGYKNEMPATGGGGVKRIETIGAILISGSVSLYFLIKRRSKRIKN